MAALRRALLLRLPKALTAPPAAPVESWLISGSFSSSRFLSDRISDDIDLSNEESKRRIVNRLLYRSKQRGFLELDLVMGKWVEDNIHSMDEARIRALADIIDLENPELWRWITGQEQPPEAVNNNPVFNAIRSNVVNNLKNAPPETRAAPGQPWVRGWDDQQRKDGPIYGNQ